jgi:hypothetical protein
MSAISRAALTGAICVCVALSAASCSRSNQQEAANRTQTEQQQPSAGIQVSDIEIGRGIGADKRVTDATSSFKPDDTIYAAVVTNGTSPAEIKARWTYQDGQVVDESVQHISPNGTESSEFHISKPNGWPAGKYTLEVFLNGASAGTKQFEVVRS